MNGRQLRKLFADLNEHYFGERLPQYRIHVRRIGSSGFCDWRKGVITLAPQSDQVQHDTLIHEMAHAATKCGHSPKFVAELQRLKTLGLLIPEANQGFGKSRLRKIDFTNEATEAMNADDGVVYADFVRGINDINGYADSVSAFNRRYPWAKRAFGAAKTRFASYQKQVQAMQKTIAGATARIEQ